MQLILSLWARLAPFVDPRAWALIAVCAGGVWLFDPVLVMTVLQWVLLFGVFAGFAIIISRHTFPQIDLTAHVREALYNGNPAAGLVVLGVTLFMAFLVLSLTLWGKA